MKIITSLVLPVLLFSACQKKQVFTQSPEIDLVKKGDAAYFAGDWTTLRSLYDDTTKIFVNNWGEKALTPDEFIESLKKGGSNYKDIKQGAGAIYEMVITDKGKVYVHSWWQWTGTHKNGEQVKSVIHGSFEIAGGKVVWQGALYNELPFFLANQKSDSTVMK